MNTQTSPDSGQTMLDLQQRLVALHGAELLEIAAEKNVRYLYEQRLVEAYLLYVRSAGVSR